MDNRRPTHRGQFEVAIICALPLEYDAASLLFDEFWDNDNGQLGKAPGDSNTYTTGRIGRHNVVLVLLPHMGKVNAASASACLRMSYARIRLEILLGICGAVPVLESENHREVLLGDVVLSNQVVQHDFGRLYPDGFIRKDSIKDNLSKPNKEILSLLAVIQTELGLQQLQEKTAFFLGQLQGKATYIKRRACYSYPGTSCDKLFEAGYRHMHHVPSNCICQQWKVNSDPVCENAINSSCDSLGCDRAYLIERHRLKQLDELGLGSGESPMPFIHVGAIASGDTVVKSGEHRDAIAKKDNVIAFEMEGAGIWNETPCLIIKGVCYYSDSHKNKVWQDFAAATAASSAKAILERYIQTDRSMFDDTTVSTGSLNMHWHHMDPPMKDTNTIPADDHITQCRSEFRSDVDAEAVRQGNELEISSPRRGSYLQEGSDFGGTIRAHSVLQGNRLTL